MIHATHVEALDGYRLRVSFSDGTSGIADMRATLESCAPLRRLLDATLFRRAFLAHGTVCWPGDLDIAVESVYGQAHGLPDADTLEQANANEAEMRRRQRFAGKKS